MADRRVNMQKTHGGENLYKFVGTENDKFKRGTYYTYRQMSKLTGLAIPTLRTRLGCIEGKVITDEVIAPKRKPFTNADGTLFSHMVKENMPNRLETDSEKMMDKYLRVAL
jgi:hypothetical protein